MKFLRETVSHHKSRSLENTSIEVSGGIKTDKCQRQEERLVVLFSPMFNKNRNSKSRKKHRPIS